MATLREIVEKHPLSYVAFLIITSFTAGIATYETVLRISGRETIGKSDLDALRSAAAANGDPVARMFKGSKEQSTLTGTWRRDYDGARITLKQQADQISFFAEGDDITHILSGEFEPGVFRTTTIRRNIKNGCETRLYGYIKVLDSRHFQNVVEASDGRCDLPVGFRENFIWTRQ